MSVTSPSASTMRKGLAHGVARDPEVGREAILSQPLPGGIVAVDDPPAQLDEHLVPQREVWLPIVSPAGDLAPPSPCRYPSPSPR